MSHHHPVPSVQLQIYQALSGRMHFSKDGLRTYQNDLKGFIGEKMFSKMIKNDLAIPHLALHSLLYADKGNHFQPDCMLLIPDQLHLLEIKNFEGEFVYKDDYLYSYTADKYYRDPVDQLKRGRLHLQNMLPKLNIPLQIYAYVIFVNPSFTLFQAEKDPYTLLSTQLKSYFKQLNTMRGPLPEVYHTYRKQLLAQHRPESPFTNVPDYVYEKLQKGVFCHDCRRPMQQLGYQLTCLSCINRECIDSGVLRMTLEFHLLFPDSEIKTGIIHHWCGEMVSARTINRIFRHYLKKVSKGRSTHYLFH